MKFWLAVITLFALGCSPMAVRPSATSLEFSHDVSVVQQDENPAHRKDNSLYRPSRQVTDEEFNTPALLEFISRMHTVMAEKLGIGIAANQLGKNIQVFMIEAKSDNPRYHDLGAVPLEVFINPRIVRASAERRNFWHGCLSAVGKKRGNVATYEWINIEAKDPAGHEIKKRLSGFAAVIFQHEFRHMLGGTYLDKAKTFIEKAELDEKVAVKEVPFFERTDDKLPLLIGDYHVGETLEEYYARAPKY